MGALTRNEATGEADLESLRQPILVSGGAVAIIMAWAWVVAIGTTLSQPVDLRPIVPPLALLAAAVLAVALQRLPLRWRCFILLAGCFSLLALGFLWEGSVTWLYYDSLVATIAALLAGPAASFIMATLMTAVPLAAPALGIPGLPAQALLAPLGLLWSTAAVSWLFSRNLYTVLHWALRNEARARQTADEVTRRREQLRRTLDSLHNAHAALERTTRDLEAARLEAEEARQVKSRFVANISHELRTPLNIIVGFAQMLCTSPEVYGGAHWPPALREDLLAIRRNAEHLLNMVDDVLDLAQIEAAHLPIAPEPTDLTQLLRDALVTASGLLRDHPLELKVAFAPGVPVLNLDRTRIRQVVLNLINNAVRFTEQGTIEVGTHLRDQEVVVYVRDSGSGIPADRLEAIFQEFEQVDTSLRRPHQGAGLGLAVSRQFVRLHGGRIWAESELGQGSTFYFSLPLPGKQVAVQPLQPRRSGGRATPSNDNHSAVVLCHDPVAVRLLERYLEGSQLLVAESAAEAASLVEQWHPDAAYTIADAPSGWEAAMLAAQELLNAVQPYDLTVVVCSLPTERGASQALGVAELLVKPVTQPEVVGAIKRLVPSPGRLLVVDDDPDMQRLLTRMVQHEWRHAEVLVAASGEAAAALLPREPDVILLDLLMPGMAGAEFLDVLRADRRAKATPVVVVTARGPAQRLQSHATGRLQVMRNGNLTATELVRLLSLLTKALPPRYVPAA